MGIPTPRELYRGPWREEKIRALPADVQVMEGYVVRRASSFPLGDFARQVAKWVRAQHVQTDEHWMHSSVVPNMLRGQE